MGAKNAELHSSVSCRTLVQRPMTTMPPPLPPPFDLSRSILDAVSAQVAVLDAEGRIVQVNRAWEQFAKANGADGDVAWVGQNYLAACGGAAAAADDPTPSLAVAGIRSVLAGHRDEYTLEYPCHGPHEPRWFQMRARRMSTPREGFYCVVWHENITVRVLAEQHLLVEREVDRQSGLANRRRLERQWALMWERSRPTRSPLALLWVEVQPGAAASADPGADEAGRPWRRLGAALQALGGHADAMAARYDGDRLVLVVPGAAEATAEALPQAWRDALDEQSRAEPLAAAPPCRVWSRLVRPDAAQSPRQALAALAACPA